MALSFAPRAMNGKAGVLPTMSTNLRVNTAYTHAGPIAKRNRGRILLANIDRMRINHTKD